MRRPVTLVTGAGGEIGHGLITRLAQSGRPIVTVDITPLDPALGKLTFREFTGSITDPNLLERILAEFEVDLVVHLAALLSTRAEFTPITAHHVNVEGTLNLLEFAQHEDEWNTPRTMYGCNKLYCEHLGRYYARFYKQLAAQPPGSVDFRCVRFPGLISAMTMPSGGTSDYAPEMIHAAAKGERYNCFVRPDTRIPFMAMPDAIDALLRLAAAPRQQLTRSAYNLSSFSPTAQEIHEATMSWKTDVKRQGIVDSWPADVDDAAARRDWGFEPKYDFRRAFE